MKNKQAKCAQIDKIDTFFYKKESQRHIKSLFCYGDDKNKKIIWSMKTDPKFCKSDDGKKLMKIAVGEINLLGIIPETIIVCPPSSSYWQNKKSFDHMHIFAKTISKQQKYTYIPYAIVPRLDKKTQKVLNKIERLEQSSGAYSLSNYFKYFLKKILNNKQGLNISSYNILVIDDVKTTGATLIECSGIIENYIRILLNKRGLDSLPQTKVIINCLAIAYEA